MIKIDLFNYILNSDKEYNRSENCSISLYSEQYSHAGQGFLNVKTRNVFANKTNKRIAKCQSLLSRCNKYVTII